MVDPQPQEHHRGWQLQEAIFWSRGSWQNTGHGWNVQVLQAHCTKARTCSGRGQVLQDTAAGVTTVVATGEHTLIHPCQAVSRASSENLGQLLKHVPEVRISLPLQRRNIRQNS